MGQKEHKKGKCDFFVVVEEDFKFAQGSLLSWERDKDTFFFLSICNRFGDCIFQTQDLDASSKKRWVF